MGNDSNVTIDGEVDARFTSYFDPQEHGQMSETIAATSDDDLHSEETISLPNEVNTDNITDTQKKIIETAVMHPNSSTAKVSELADVSDSYVKNTLRDNCPEWYDNTFKTTNTDNSTQPKGLERSDMLSYIRENNGASIQELSEEFDIAGNTVQYHLGKLGGSVTSQKGVDGYHHSARVYYPVDSSSDTTESEISEEERSDHTDLEVAIEAMKATAQNEETVTALEVVEEYL